MQNPEASATVSFHPNATTVVRFGRFSFDRVNHILSAENGEIALPPRVLAILDLLLERAGSVVSKQTIMGSVWRDACVGDTSLTEAVSLLRQALDDDPKNPEYIQTVHRRGYRFVAPVVVAGKVRAPLEVTADRESRRGRSLPHRSLAAKSVAVVLTVGLAIVAVLILTSRRGHDVGPVNGTAIRLDISSPQGVFLPFFTTSTLALSPDGEVLVFVGRDDDDEKHLYRRQISEFDSHVIPGTQGAGSPFFSPDGVWVAFFADGELRKTPLGGGAVNRICRSTIAFGGSWAEDGTIVFAGSHPSGLSIVSADGGEVRELTPLRASDGVLGHWWPQVLPGDRGVLYTIWSSTLATARVAVLDLDTGEERTLIDGASYPRYSPRGVILYVTPGGLTSVPFDLEDLVVTGPSQEMVDQPRANPFVGVAKFTVAGNGTLAYLPAAEQYREYALVRIDRAGMEKPIGLEHRLYRNLRVDPQGETLAVTILDGPRSDVWTTSLASPTLNRLTFSGFNIEPRWSPDGEWVVFASNRDGPFNIYRKPADGDGAAERLVVSDLHQYPGGFTPDGSSLVYSRADPITGSDIWIMSLTGSEKSARPLINTPANENMPSLSPDGRWMSYISDETGRWEVYLRSTSGEGGVWQLSTDGAGEASWSADGSSVFFGQKNALVSVAVTFEPEFARGQATTFPWSDDLTVVDSLPSGDEFIAIKALAERPQIDAVRVVVNPD